MEQPDYADLRRLMDQTATAQIEIRRKLEDMSVEDLLKLQAQVLDEKADLEAEIRLLTKAIAFKEARGDAD